MVRYLKNQPRLLLGLKLLFVALFALAVTVPFAGQAFSFDGPLVLDYAAMQAEHPLQQHLEDFDYFGMHYDRFNNTHPRFLSMFLSLVVRLTGGISEVPIHVSLVVFPIAGGVSMFFLGRRFGVSGTAAALLFLSSPIMMVAAHVEMVDAPGISLWVSSLAAFIYGVDRKNNWLLALAGLLFVLTIFTFFQGLTVLGLALFYLLLKKRFGLMTLAPVLAAVAAFAAYIIWFFFYYGALPRFSYREINVIRINAYYMRTLPVQLRSVIIILGGAALFPLVTLLGSLRNLRALLVLALTAASSWPWLYGSYQDGAYTGREAFLMAAFLLGGILLLYMVVEQTVIGSIAWVRKGNNDVLLLCAWILSVFVYCVVILSYPAPRYLLPAVPPIVLYLLVLWRGVAIRWQSLRTIAATAAIGLTLSMGVLFSIVYMDYARLATEEVRWIQEEYGGWPGRVWFAGEFGFNYYMRKSGYTMIPNVQGIRYSETDGLWPQENAQPGDLIVISTLYGGWLPFSDVVHRMVPVEEKIIRSDSGLLLITPISPEQRSRWSLSILLPYSLPSGSTIMDDIWVWRVSDPPHPIWPETEEELAKWE